MYKSIGQHTTLGSQHSIFFVELTFSKQFNFQSKLTCRYMIWLLVGLVTLESKV